MVFKRLCQCCVVAVGVLASLAIAAVAGEAPKLGNAFERHRDVHLVAYDLLKQLNTRSISTNLEFCGYIYREAGGALAYSKPRKGGSHGCTTNQPPAGVEILASYHTHAAYAYGSLNEYPSDIDLQSDFQSGMNGYIATPGGRLWFVESDKRVARQLCGYRCLPWDSHYREAPADRPRKSVTIGYINKILSEGIAE